MISKEIVNKISSPYLFNMVNSDNKDLKKLGLEPLYLKVYPKYITPSGNIFYSGLPHRECNLIFDIQRNLDKMNLKSRERYETPRDFICENYFISFAICNRQIFFGDTRSLYLYKSNKKIRDEIIKKFNLKEEFYEPTPQEIRDGYGINYYRSIKDQGYTYEYHHLNFTAKEVFENMIRAKTNSLKTPYTNPNDLTDQVVRYWLNRTSNLYWKIPYEITGLYNQEAMEFINNLRNAKYEIYSFFNDFSKKAIDWKKVIKELLITYHAYEEFVQKEKVEGNIFDNEEVFEEEEYWFNMFSKIYQDLLIQFIGFDKIETQTRKTITTSRTNIYEEFFNLLIMDYEIKQIPKLIFDEETQHFRWIKQNEFINAGINRECEKDIQLIKKYVPYKDRHLYFKD